MNPEAALPVHRLEAGTSIVQTQPWQTAPVTLDAPALAVMTDLTRVKAATTVPATSLRQAEQLMIHQGVRMLFVVTEMPFLEGLVTASELRGDRAVRLTRERHLRYDELCVGDVMASLDALDAVAYADLQGATVRNLVATLRQLGRDHLLVVEAAPDAAAPRVRGVVSRSQIERQLGTPIPLVEVAGSFAELGRMLS